MKDQKERSDLAHKLSDVCIKIALTALALSALAFALGERFVQVPAFEAFGKFVLARENLNAQIGDLEADSCWQIYLATLPERTAATHITLHDLAGIQCSDQAPGSVKIGSTIVSPGDTNNVVIHFGGSTTLPNVASPSSPAHRSPHQASQQAVPAPPTDVRIEFWFPLAEAESIGRTLKALWDERTLGVAEKYSETAAEEIYRWRLQRFRLFRRRVIPAELYSPHPATEANFDISGLWISDLREIDKASHTSLIELDRVIHDQFRAPLPDTSYGVTIVTAAQIVAATLTLLGALLAAYVKAALNADARSTPGTVFKVLLGSSWGRFTGCMVTVVPFASVGFLNFSMALSRSAGISVVACTAMLGIVTFVTVSRLVSTPQQFRWIRL